MAGISTHSRPTCARAWLVLLPCALLACVLLTSCGHPDQDGGPVAWWHDLEGGPIAADRPPPPGIRAPYPNLSTVPAKPAPPDHKAEAATYAALAADRADATYEAAQDPLTKAPPKDDATGLFAPAKPLPAASPDASSAAMDAAAPKPKPIPAKPQPPSTLSVAQQSAAAETPIPDIVQDATPAPPIPDAPPPQPSLAGVAIPITIPHLPPKAPPPAPTLPGALSEADAAPIPIAFPEGSAILDSAGQSALATLAKRRGPRTIEITGFGEADEEDAGSQIAGVTLAAARARAIAAALEGNGVPITAMRLAANAAGRGAAARLVE